MEYARSPTRADALRHIAEGTRHRDPGKAAPLNLARGIERGDLRADTDARLLLEMLVAPIHGRLLLTGEPVDGDLAERLVELALNGAAAR